MLCNVRCIVFGQLGLSNDDDRNWRERASITLGVGAKRRLSPKRGETEKRNSPKTLGKAPIEGNPAEKRQQYTGWQGGLCV